MQEIMNGLSFCRTTSLTSWRHQVLYLEVTKVLGLRTWQTRSRSYISRIILSVAISVSDEFLVEVAEERLVGWLAVARIRSKIWEEQHLICIELSDGIQQFSATPDLHQLSFVAAVNSRTLRQCLSVSIVQIIKIPSFKYCSSVSSPARLHSAEWRLRQIGKIFKWSKLRISSLWESVMRCLVLTITVSNLCSLIMTSECS